MSDGGESNQKPKTTHLKPIPASEEPFSQATIGSLPKT